MGLIREPEDVDFTVESLPITNEDKKQISDVISHFKKTGEIRKSKTSKKKVKREKA